MRNPAKFILLILFFSLSAAYFYLSRLSAGTNDIKQPNVAGAFYPDNLQELSEMVDNFLKAAQPQKLAGDIFALICPHAGYGYSGAVAAYGYKLAQNNPYKTIVIIGASHHYGFSGVSVYPQGRFRTPLGDLEIDKDFTQQLLNRDSEILFLAAGFAKEHSVEVQLPFLQRSLSGFKIVPIVTGDCTLSTCEKLAKLLKDAIGERKDVLVVASTDAYHGYDYTEAEAMDAQTITYLKNMDAAGLYYGLREGKLQLCAGFAVVTTLLLASEMGHNSLSVLKYTHSAAVTGNRNTGNWTVGYLSCAIDQEKGEPAMLNKKQRQILLEIARNSIQTYLTTGKKLEVVESDPLLSQKMGVFVTLHQHHELRGCIGDLIGRQPLYLSVRDMAVEAAVNDPRFAAVDLTELKDINIELSVLSPMQLVSSLDEIQLGKHGVLVKSGLSTGVFLPQVATETGWSKEEFLSHLCSQKAGLNPQAWKDKSTQLYVFTAEVFSENKD